MEFETMTHQEAVRYAPAQESERQLFFIKRLRYKLKQRFEKQVETGQALEQYGKDKLEQMLAKEAYATLCLATFGCQMNARDSEKLLGVLEQAGFVNQEDEDADLVLYNTCTVRDNANQRVYGRLGRIGTMKKKHPDKLVALCGCMMQEPEVIDKIKHSYPFVDLIFGTHNIFKAAELLDRRMEEQSMVVDVWKGTDEIVEDLPVDRKYKFKSGVNIMFGCDNYCSYCIVPYVRGRERSREPGGILEEIRRLAADGVVEVMLLGQNVNSYGKHLNPPITFAQLLKQVDEIPGIERIRFMTSHPKDLSDDLIQVMAQSKHICRHLHLPLQSGSSRILSLMNRRYDKEQYLALVEKLRAAMPELALTTDIIVGFPGETEEDFEETMDVVRRVRYDSAFTFIYSKRTGTPAAAMENQVDEETVKRRFDRLLKEVQTIAAQVSGRELHTTQKVLVEEVNDRRLGFMTGRLESNTLVHFPGDASMIGKIVDVYLNEHRGFYYIGT